MVSVTYTGVRLGVGTSEVVLQRVQEVPEATSSLAQVRQLAGGARRAVSSPNRDQLVGVVAEEVPWATVRTLRAWQGQVVRVRTGWGDPVWCLLRAVELTTTVRSQQHSRDRVEAVSLELVATTATAATAT